MCILLIGPPSHRSQKQISSLWAVLTLTGCKTCIGLCRGRQIISNILQGLEYLHGLGIAHLGLTSHNIMLDKEGQAKIANVGLGKFVSTYGTLPTTAGSPLWASPEQINGEVMLFFKS